MTYDARCRSISSADPNEDDHGASLIDEPSSFQHTSSFTPNCFTPRDRAAGGAPAHGGPSPPWQRDTLGPGRLRSLSIEAVRQPVEVQDARGGGRLPGSRRVLWNRVAQQPPPPGPLEGRTLEAPRELLLRHRHPLGQRWAAPPLPREERLLRGLRRESVPGADLLGALPLEPFSDRTHNWPQHRGLGAAHQRAAAYGGE
jgi:hypothetical protein